jgi:hypothetical protein
MTPGSATARYAIDHDGRIAWTDEGFAALAADHGCPELTGDRPVGRSLFGFVAGERPRALQHALIDKAHATGEPLELRYRCDAPAMRRHAILRIEPQAGGGVVFTTWFTDTEERSYQALLDVALARSDQTIALCAWCKRVDAGGWREADEVATAAGADPPRIDHTVCQICEMLLANRPAAGPTRSGPSGPA